MKRILIILFSVLLLFLFICIPVFADSDSFYIENNGCVALFYDGEIVPCFNDPTAKGGSLSALDNKSQWHMAGIDYTFDDTLSVFLGLVVCQVQNLYHESNYNDIISFTNYVKNNGSSLFLSSCRLLGSRVSSTLCKNASLRFGFSSDFITEFMVYYSWYVDSQGLLIDDCPMPLYSCDLTNDLWYMSTCMSLVFEKSLTYPKVLYQYRLYLYGHEPVHFGGLQEFLDNLINGLNFSQYTAWLPSSISTVLIVYFGMLVTLSTILIGLKVWHG